MVMHTHLAPQMVFENPHHCLMRPSFPGRLAIVIRIIKIVPTTSLEVEKRCERMFSIDNNLHKNQNQTHL